MQVNRIIVIIEPKNLHSEFLIRSVRIISVNHSCISSASVEWQKYGLNRSRFSLPEIPNSRWFLHEFVLIYGPFNTTSYETFLDSWFQNVWISDESILGLLRLYSGIRTARYESGILSLSPERYVLPLSCFHSLTWNKFLPILYDFILWQGIKTSVFSSPTVFSHYDQVSTGLHAVPHVYVVIKTQLQWVVWRSVRCKEGSAFEKVHLEGKIAVSRCWGIEI